MADADPITAEEAFNLILDMASGDEALKPTSIKGRWVWGKQASAAGPGMVHVQIYPSDPITTALAMQTITSNDMRLGREARGSKFRQQRVAIALRLNKEAVETHGLELLLRRDGLPTKNFLRMIRGRAVNNSACTFRSLR